MNTSSLGETLARQTLDLVRIPSVSGQEQAIADTIQEYLSKRTTPSSLNRHGSAVVARYGEDAPGLVLVGHLDTVPFNEHPDPSVDGESVVGLGSTDMKGALAVMLALAEALGPRPAPESDPASLALVFYDNEEVAFEKNGLRPLFDAEPWLMDSGLALLMEPTDNVVELGCLGTIHAEVSFLGKAGHTARPWTGENAIHKAAPFLARIASIPPREVTMGPVAFKEVLSATVARGGEARNVIPDRFTLNLNFRFAPDRSQAEAEDHVKSMLPEGVEVVITDSAPAAEPRHDAPLLEALICRNVLEIRSKQAWTDVAQFSQRGVPAANFGPGLPELAHRRDERVSINSLVRSYLILAEFLGIAGPDA